MTTAKQIAHRAAQALDAKKGQDIKLLRVTDVTTLADYFLICTGTSNTHVNTLCDEVEKVMTEAGETHPAPGRPPQRHLGAAGLRLPGCPRLYRRHPKILRPGAPVERRRRRAVNLRRITCAACAGGRYLQTEIVRIKR